MSNLESTPEQHASMPCSFTEKLIPDLEEEGWEYEWSFHARFTDQWNDACDRVKALQHNLVQGQDEAEKETVLHISTKKGQLKEVSGKKNKAIYKGKYFYYIA